MNNSVTIRDYRTEIPGGLTPDRMRWVFPTVSTMTSHKNISNWVINVRLRSTTTGEYIPINDSHFDSLVQIPNVNAEIKVDVGINGNINKNVPTVVKSGKNVGKVNATNVLTQALRDALGMYNKKCKKVTTYQVDNNVEKVPTDSTDCKAPELLPPMLAQVLKDQTKQPLCDETHTLYVQPKYNGVRAVTTLSCELVDGKTKFSVVMYSRGKKLYPGFGYIKDELFEALTDYWSSGTQLYVDGEIYSHGTALQDISGHARRGDKPGDTRYNYMIYDCFDARNNSLIYSQRKLILDEMFANYKFTHCSEVPTWPVKSYDDVNRIYAECLAKDFEGAMVRVDAPYMYSFNAHHCKELLKMKPAYDAELVICGWETGRKGKAAEAIMIKCATPEGIEFPVTPAMELPMRIALAKKMAEVEPNGKTHFENHWKGQKIIVTYDELSKDKVPQRARTEMVIRTWD